MSLMVGIGKGAENGILIRSGEALQTAQAIKTVVLDKTGTITKGKPELTDVAVTGAWLADDLLRLVAAVERSSEHPLAEAIVEGAMARNLTLAEPTAFEAVPGYGVLATVEAHKLAIGNLKLMQREGIALGSLESQAAQLADQGKTPMYVAVDGQAAGIIAVADTVKADSAEAIAALHRMGIEVVMITGDNRRTAEAIAKVLPGDKAAEIHRLREAGEIVAMVGDGINDAPALATADIGIAIGAGTDVAIETADVVLMRSDPLDVPVALRIGKGTLRKMRQNLAWAIGYNTIALPIAAGVFQPSLGISLSPEIAALSMSGSSVIVAVNALLLKRLRLPQQEVSARPAAAPVVRH